MPSLRVRDRRITGRSRRDPAASVLGIASATPRVAATAERRKGARSESSAGGSNAQNMPPRMSSTNPARPAPSGISATPLDMPTMTPGCAAAARSPIARDPDGRSCRRSGRELHRGEDSVQWPEPAVAARQRRHRALVDAQHIPKAARLIQRALNHPSSRRRPHLITTGAQRGIIATRRRHRGRPARTLSRRHEGRPGATRWRSGQDRGRRRGRR